MIISDSATLIILSDLKRLDLLDNLFEKIYIPCAVYDEINFKKDIDMPLFMEVVKVEQSELLNSLKLVLDDGESEAIALAKVKQLPLIIDEKKGRKIAQNIDIKIIGLLGVIYLNIKKRFISLEDAKIFLSDAIDGGYRISQKLIDEMLESISFA